MYTARARGTSDQWIEPPELAFGRYLLRSRHRAANDNRRLSPRTFPTLQVAACMGLSSALTLIVALVR
jgi:hypothetical protein